MLSWRRVNASIRTVGEGSACLTLHAGFLEMLIRLILSSRYLPCVSHQDQPPTMVVVATKEFASAAQSASLRHFLQYPPLDFELVT